MTVLSTKGCLNHYGWKVNVEAGALLRVMVVGRAYFVKAFYIRQSAYENQRNNGHPWPYSIVTFYTK